MLGHHLGRYTRLRLGGVAVIGKPLRQATRRETGKWVIARVPSGSFRAWDGMTGRVGSPRSGRNGTLRVTFLRHRNSIDLPPSCLIEITEAEARERAANNRRD